MKNVAWWRWRRPRDDSARRSLLKFSNVHPHTFITSEREHINSCIKFNSIILTYILKYMRPFFQVWSYWTTSLEYRVLFTLLWRPLKRSAMMSPTVKPTASATVPWPTTWLPLRLTAVKIVSFTVIVVCSTVNAGIVPGSTWIYWMTTHD